MRRTKKMIAFATMIMAPLMVGLTVQPAAAAAAAEAQALPDGVYDVYSGGVLVGHLVVSGGTQFFVPLEREPLGPLVIA